VRLSASLVGDVLTVVLRDDGRGLQRDRLVAEGRRRGLVPPHTELSDADAYALIFAPGFSTASALTTLSGRGVGMDVVRERIEALNGHISIQSVPGVGTTFTIQVPEALRLPGRAASDLLFPVLADEPIGALR
jgi:two-component system chemotaxis sensor kinase CheA